MPNAALYIDTFSRSLIRKFNAVPNTVPTFVLNDIFPLNLFFFTPDPILDVEYISQRIADASIRLGIAKIGTGGFDIGMEANGWDEVVPDAGSITLTDEGSYPGDVGYSGRTTTKLAFSAIPAGGTFTLTIEITLAPGRTETRTVVIPAAAGASQIATLIRAAIGGTINVSGTAGVVIYISMNFEAVVTVDDSDVNFGANYGWVGDIDLTDSRLIALVGARASVNMTLEVEVTVGGYIETFIQTPVNVAANVLT